MNKFSSKSWQKAFPNLPELESCTITITEGLATHSIPTIEFDKSSFESSSKGPSRKRTRPWKPLTQKAHFLAGVILVSGGIIAVLQIFLLRSNRDNGIIFAPNINELPISQSFCYLYLPTIISISLSFTWTWIDLDIKRLQPYWQLSRKGGASGKSSLLLHYPFDFLAFVPFRAIKQRHWPVFSASLAVVMIVWGLTPLQSSIFATEDVKRTAILSTSYSAGYIPTNKQNSLLTGSYTQSVYNIAWLNETLPPFMTREGMLVPFGLTQQPPVVQTAETLTGLTTLYSVDLTCHNAIETDASWNSQNGCKYSTSGLGTPTDVRHDQYYSTYIGFWYEELMDDYLDGSCPMSSNQTLLVQWARGQRITEHVHYGDGAPYTYNLTEPLAATTIYCVSSYYQQDVNATIVPPSMSVASIVPVGPKRPLPADLFNVTSFEADMNAGADKFQVRGEYPQSSSWPDAWERVSYLDLSQSWNFLPPLMGYAIAAYKRPAADYMDADLLGDSYQAAYRLLFARRLSDVLSLDLDHSKNSSGLRSYQTQAVVLVPIFVYIVEALIGITGLAACVVVYLSYTTANNLKSDPANLASLMALAAEDSSLCSQIGRFDQSSAEDIKEAFADSTFGLLEETKVGSGQGYGLKLFGHPSGERSVPRTILSADRMLPKEFSWISGATFLVLQLLILSVLIYSYVWSHTSNGIPLPSSSLLINQLVENYVPVIIAAFYEPIWVVLNRLLCMLQPYEQLRKGNAPAKRTLTVDYNSLPPQAVVGRALRAGHLSLAIICIMALLANVLSVASSSLTYESNVEVSKSAKFKRPYQFPMNGTSLGNDTFASLTRKPDYDQFHVAISNATAGTSLPPWTDQHYFYLPFNGSIPLNKTADRLRATTVAVEASLDCVPLTNEGSNTVKWQLFTVDGDGDTYLAMNATYSRSDGSVCDLYLYEEEPVTYTYSQISDGHALELVAFPSTDNDSTCRTSVVAGWIRATNSTKIHSNLTDDWNLADGSWIACTPIIEITQREVTVDFNGYIQSAIPVNGSTDVSQPMFEPSQEAYTLSFHKLLSNGYEQGMLATFHNDTYPSDFYNYLMDQARNSSSFLDPKLPPPTFEDASSAFSALYSELFAIVLGTNIDKVFQPTGTTTIDGFTVTSETRIFFSEPMFVLSTVILALYVVATLIIYARRPWRILPRMPISIANQMAFFAGSHAIEELAGTAAMTASGRKIYIHSMGYRYGFGRFLGTDGKGHVGIEREPLVQVMGKHELRMQREGEEEGKGASWGWFRSKRSHA